MKENSTDVKKQKDPEFLKDVANEVRRKLIGYLAAGVIALGLLILSALYFFAGQVRERVNYSFKNEEVSLGEFSLVSLRPNEEKEIAIPKKDFILPGLPETENVLVLVNICARYTYKPKDSDSPSNSASLKVWMEDSQLFYGNCRQESNHSDTINITWFELVNREKTTLNVSFMGAGIGEGSIKIEAAFAQVIVFD